MIIRYKCFETNSSSTHALCIGRSLTLNTPLELVTQYKQGYIDNDFEELPHYKEYLPITDTYYKAQIKKNYLSHWEEYTKQQEELKEEIDHLDKYKKLKLFTQTNDENNKTDFKEVQSVNDLLKDVVTTNEDLIKDKIKDFQDTDTYLNYCDNYCTNYMNNNTDTLLLRRIMDLGRKYNVYETPMSKLNFIWSSICCYANRDIIDDNRNILGKGIDLITTFLFQLESKGFKLKFMDIKKVESNTVTIKEDRYNKPKILFTLDGEDYIGVETYGYAPIQELYKVVTDSTLFFNLVFGKSKIYTGSDEYGSLQDLTFDNYLYKLVGGSDTSNCCHTNIHSYMNKQPLGQYQNGNYITKIYEDGTRIRKLQPENIYYDNGIFRDDVFKQKELDLMKPIFPESIDLKITNYCENGCSFCYANSDTNGKHANTDFVKSIIDQMYPYTEIAIGGGNPLSHPNLIDILQYAKSKNVICNITLKDIDIVNNKSTVDNLLRKNLIRCVGISMSNISNLKQAIDIVNYARWDSYIVHLIIGLVDETFFTQVEESNLYINKVLFLGYKCLGRGEDLYNKNKKFIEKNSEWLKHKIQQGNLPFNGEVIAFDNLAITQLNLLEDKYDYKSLYQGEDGKFSFYIDAVEQTYAKSSLSEYKDTYYDMYTLEDMLKFTQN